MTGTKRLFGNPQLIRPKGKSLSRIGQRYGVVSQFEFQVADLISIQPRVTPGSLSFNSQTRPLSVSIKSVRFPTC